MRSVDHRFPAATGPYRTCIRRCPPSPPPRTATIPGHCTPNPAAEQFQPNHRQKDLTPLGTCNQQKNWQNGLHSCWIRQWEPRRRPPTPYPPGRVGSLRPSRRTLLGCPNTDPLQLRGHLERYFRRGPSGTWWDKPDECERLYTTR